MKLTGRNGILRILESSAILHGQAPLANLTVDMVKYNGVDTWSNLTTNLEVDDANVETAFLADDNDAVYIGSTSVFAMIYFLLGGGSNYAVASGALIATYYDGTDFVTALTGVSDGTLAGGDCFAQDGYISFKIPSDWAIGANSFNANLDADKYYIKLMATTAPATDPDADVLCPVDGQYFDLVFAGMDFNGPLGRPKTEEQLVLNRGTMDANAHYIQGPHGPIHDPLEISFSCLLDTTANKDKVMEALACGNPGADRWTSAGVTSKGTTKNDGTNFNPAFADSNKKTGNIQMLWDTDASGAVAFGLAFYETYFPDDQQSLSEGEDAITLSCKGAVYGVIERIYGFGNRY